MGTMNYEASMQEMVDKAMEKFDLDRNGSLSFGEFYVMYADFIHTFPKLKQINKMGEMASLPNYIYICFGLVDTDKSLSLDKEELLNAFKNALKLLVGVFEGLRSSYAAKKALAKGY